MCFLWYFQKHNQTPKNIFQNIFWNATKHLKIFSFSENSISGKYLFSGKYFTWTKQSLIKFRLRLVRVKVFLENILFFGNAIFRKGNVFMSLVAFPKMFRKIFSDVWLCSWKYHRKHIFYLLLTFSRLPNEYIISFISQNTNKTHKKKIIKSEQTKARSRSVRSALHAKIEASIAIAIGATALAGDVGGRWCRDRFSLSLSSIFQGRK